MPGFTTHYLFGIHMYKKLSSTYLKTTIKNNRYAYLLGLQGPDIFFYYPPNIVGIEKDNYGSIIHTCSTRQFFENYLTALEHVTDDKEKEIGTAYLSGFLCHYSLDTSSHPFVYARTNYQTKPLKKQTKDFLLAEHINYETNLDTLLLQRYKKLPPSLFHQHKTLSINHKELRTLTKLITYAINKTYSQNTGASRYTSISAAKVHFAIRSIQYGTRLLKDESGKKKNLVKKAESIFRLPAVLSNIIPSDHVSSDYDYLNLSKEIWISPWDLDMERRESFLDLYHQAEKKCSRTLAILNRYAKCSYTLTNYIVNKDDLLKNIGNYCYHSGLPL